MIAGSIVSVVGTVVSTAAQIGAKASQAKKASAAARQAQDEDTAARVREENEALGQSLLAAMSSQQGGPNDPSMQDYLEQVGYVPRPGDPSEEGTGGGDGGGSLV